MTLLYKIGRLLQFAGLVLLPIAIAGELAERMDLKQSLTISAIGCSAFLLGWLIQQRTKPQ